MEDSKPKFRVLVEFSEDEEVKEEPKVEDNYDEEVDKWGDEEEEEEV